MPRRGEGRERERKSERRKPHRISRSINFIEPRIVTRSIGAFMTPDGESRFRGRPGEVVHDGGVGGGPILDGPDIGLARVIKVTIVTTGR